MATDERFIIPIAFTFCTGNIFSNELSQNNYSEYYSPHCYLHNLLPEIISYFSKLNY